MNPFSEKFQYYLDEKGMKVGDVQRYSQLNLTTLYKFLNGTRKPTNVEQVEKIADSLCLNRTQRDELMESFFLTRLGPIGYYGRKEVKKFYREINLEHVEGAKPLFPFEEISLPEGSSLTLTGQQNVNVAIEYFVQKAAKEREGAVIHISEILLHDFTHSLVENILKEYPETQFEHILCLDETLGNSIQRDGFFYNVRVLRKVLPLAVYNSKNYSVFYHYSDIPSENEDMSSLSNVIIAGDYVIQYSSNHRFALVIYDRAVSELYDTMNREEGEKLHRLVHVQGDADPTRNRETFNLFQPDGGGNSGYLYYPSVFVPLMYNDPKAEAANKILNTLISDHPHYLTTKYVIDYFSNTGMVFPFAQSSGEEKEKRPYVLDIVLKEIKDDEMSILDIGEQELPPDLCTVVTMSALYTGLPDHEGGILFAACSEPTIAHAFYDFIEDIVKENSMPKRDAVDYVEKKIAELQ